MYIRFGVKGIKFGLIVDLSISDLGLKISNLGRIYQYNYIDIYSDIL